MQKASAHVTVASAPDFPHYQLLRPLHREGAHKRYFGYNETGGIGSWHFLKVGYCCSSAHGWQHCASMPTLSLHA